MGATSIDIILKGEFGGNPSVGGCVWKRDHFGM